MCILYFIMKVCFYALTYCFKMLAFKTWKMTMLDVIHSKISDYCPVNVDKLNIR